MKGNESIEKKEGSRQLNTNFSEPENLARYFEHSLEEIMNRAMQLDKKFYTEKTNQLVTGIISRTNELLEFADIIIDYHSDTELKEREGQKLPPDTTDHKVQATRLGDNIFYAITDFKQVLNSYEILGVIETVKAKFIHDLSKIADAKDLLRRNDKK